MWDAKLLHPPSPSSSREHVSHCAAGVIPKGDKNAVRFGCGHRGRRERERQRASTRTNSSRTRHAERERWRGGGREEERSLPVSLSLSRRLKHRRFPISIEKVDFPFRSLQKRVRGGTERRREREGETEGDVLRRARAAAQQARSPTFECCFAPQRTH